MSQRTEKILPTLNSRGTSKVGVEYKNGKHRTRYVNAGLIGPGEEPTPSLNKKAERPRT